MVVTILILILIALFSLSKTKNYTSLLSLYQQKTINNYENFLAKNLKDQWIGMYMEQKARIKIRQINTDTLLDQTLHELTVCLFWFIQIKIPILKDLKLEVIIYQNVSLKNDNVIVNGKNFYDQHIDSDIKWYEKIRKLKRE